MLVRGRSARSGASALLVVATAFALLFVAPPHVAIAAPGQAMPPAQGASVRGPLGTTLTAGVDSTCAIQFGGQIVCWGGANAYGQLTAPHGTFTAVSGRFGTFCAIRSGYGQPVCWGNLSAGQGAAQSDVFTSLAVGGDFVCGIRDSGTLKCWGNGVAATGVPTGTFVAVTAGYQFACAVRTSASVVCWGNDASGQTTAPAGTFLSLSAGPYHTCGLTTNYRIDCWGYGAQGQTTNPAGTFRAVSAGRYHSCGITTAGTIVCWGGGSDGQDVAPAGTYTSIAAGYYHNCARKTDGTLYCWGRQDNGQTTPPTGTFPTASGLSIAAGGRHTCSINLYGSLGCWGLNTSHQLEAPSGRYIALSVGAFHGCAIKVDGTIACWGSNGDGQATPPAGTFIAITSGAMHTCAIRTSGTEICWGYGYWGQTAQQTGTFTAIEAGDHVSCGILVDGSLKCWGYNVNGEATPPATGSYVALGVGYAQGCAVRTTGTLACWGWPTAALPPAGTFVAVTEGQYHGCGIRTNGTVACWGNSVEPDVEAPVGETFISISSFYATVCGITALNRPICWGRNDEGEAIPAWSWLPPDPADGQPFSFTLAMSTDMYPAPNFSIVDGSLPSGLTLAANGKISGTTTAVGPHTFTVVAYNGFAPATSHSITLTVAPTAVRYAGADRFKTAVEVSKRTFPSGATTAYVAYAYNFPDALAAAAAAGTVHGPVLLTDTNSLNPDTANELTRLHPSKIIVLGSDGVISNATMMALASHAPLVQRYYGSDRFKTAVDVSKKTFPTGASTVYVAYAYNFPDALAGAAAAGTVEGPVLLTGTDSLNPDTAAELDRLHPSKILVLGSQGVISEDTLTAISHHAPLTIRYWGSSRFATAVNVSYRTFSPGVPVAYIAYAYNFPDALAGAAAAGTVKGPVLLTTTAGPIDAATAAELTRLKPHKIIVLGSSGVISDAVLNSLKAYAVP